MFHKWRAIKESWTEQVTKNWLINWLIIPSHTHLIWFQAEGSWGASSFLSWLTFEEDPSPFSAFNPNPDSSPCVLESSFQLLQSPVQEFLVSTLQLLAWPHGMILWSFGRLTIDFVFCTISLIIRFISKAVLTFQPVSLSFPPFPGREGGS